MDILNPLNEYYKKRIWEYEEIYHRNDPIRLEEIDFISESLKKLMKGRNVLEIASGTGYWTQFISESAIKIIATDYISEMLDFARLKIYSCVRGVLRPPASFFIPNHAKKPKKGKRKDKTAGDGS